MSAYWAGILGILCINIIFAYSIYVTAAAGQLNRYKLRANYINIGDKKYNDFFAWINDVQNKDKNALEILQRLK